MQVNKYNIFISILLLGAVYDITGSFTIIFYINCGSYAIASALYALIIIINKTRPAFFFPPHSSNSFGTNYSSCSNNETVGSQTQRNDVTETELGKIETDDDITKKELRVESNDKVLNKSLEQESIDNAVKQNYKKRQKTTS